MVEVRFNALFLVFGGNFRNLRKSGKNVFFRKTIFFSFSSFGVGSGGPNRKGSRDRTGRGRGNVDRRVDGRRLGERGPCVGNSLANSSPQVHVARAQYCDGTALFPSTRSATSQAVACVRVLFAACYLRASVFANLHALPMFLAPSYCNPEASATE